MINMNNDGLSAWSMYAKLNLTIIDNTADDKNKVQYALTPQKESDINRIIPNKHPKLKIKN